MKRRTVSLAAGALAFGALAAPAGGASYDYAGLGRCAPDVSAIQIDPTGASTSFTVPDGCAPQQWLVIVEDYHQNKGAAYPADGRSRLAEEHIIGTPGQLLEWTWTAPHALCGGQVDLVLEGQEQPYAAAVFEMNGGCESVGSTATPPPVPDQAPPDGSAPSVAGVSGSGGGTGADTSVATEATAGPAPLVEIATQPRVSALPATLPETGINGQPLALAEVCLGMGALSLIGAAFAHRLSRRKAER